MAQLWELPDDVIAKICSLLPAKSVLRLKGVQKSWNILVKALLKTPSFGADHLSNNNRHSTSSSTSFVLSATSKSGPNYEKKLTMLTLHHRDDDDDKEEVNHDPKKVNPAAQRSQMTLAHCDGMVCIVNPFSAAVELRNPTTGELKLLPGLGCSNKHPGSVASTLCVGFGYDAVSRAHKIVVVYRQLSNNVAKVCTLGGEDTWRDVELSAKNRSARLVSQSGVCCSGVSHWVAKFGDIYKVVRFDMHRERFEAAVSLPMALQFRVGYWQGQRRLFRHGDSVACYSDRNYAHKITRSVSVWVMSREDNCWTELNYGQLDRVGTLRGFSKSGQELLLVGRAREKRCLVAYDFAQKKKRRISYGAETIDDAQLLPFLHTFLPLPRIDTGVMCSNNIFLHVEIYIAYEYNNEKKHSNNKNKTLYNKFAGNVYRRKAPSIYLETMVK